MNSYVKLVLTLAMALGTSLPQAADTQVRFNLLGYSPQRPKILIVQSDSNLQSAPWKATTLSGITVLDGVLGESFSGPVEQSRRAYHFSMDLSALRDSGLFVVQVPSAPPETLIVRKNPYSFFIERTLRHLALMRSGGDQKLFRKMSHLGDSACPISIPDGSPSLGAWKPATPVRKLDLRGGWYDAGDYIKFTLTISQTTWHLLRAYAENPKLVARNSNPDMPTLLEEAAFGLRYLIKTVPDSQTFVVEVGDDLDHTSGSRLPQDDDLDGQRPALVAWSPAHAGSALAAMALGARLLKEIDAPLADSCATIASILYHRMTLPDAPRQAYFFKNGDFEFYKDNSWFDNLALGASEYYALRKEQPILDQALAWAKSAGPGYWASWGDQNLLANHLLSTLATAPKTAMRQDMTSFVTHADGEGQPWGIPLRQYWAPFDGYPLIGAVGASLAAQGNALYTDLVWNTFDYMTGRNNWGVNFLMSPDLRRSVKNIYSQIYRLHKEAPIGAVAEGPGSASIYNDLATYFRIPSNAPEKRFNSDSIVFYDHSSDFQTMETVIAQTAAFAWMLSAIAHMEGDTIPGEAPSSFAVSIGTRGHRSAQPRLSLSGHRLSWPAGIRVGNIVRMAPDGKCQILAQTTGAAGSIELALQNRLTWVAIEGQPQAALAVPPWR